MHILLIFLGTIAGLGFWGYRLNAARDAAGEVIDMAGRVRGSIRRKKIRQQNELSPLTAINDPVVAVATLAIAVASDDVALSDERRDATRAWLGKIAAASAADEAMIYADWAARQIDEAATVIDKLGPLLASKLTNEEKRELVEKIGEISVATGPALPSRDQRLRRLSQKIGLEVR